MDDTQDEPPQEIKISDIKADKMYKLALDVSKGEVGDFVYCLQDGKFYEYKDGWWQVIPELKLLSIMQNGIIREIKVKHGDTWRKEKGKIITKYTPAHKKHIIEHLKLIVLKELHEFNSSYLINLENYMYDPVGNNVINHKKEYYSTIRVPYKYDPLAKCDLWLKSLNEIFENNQFKINLLQEFFGYCVSPDNEQKKGLLLLGDTDTGKSTIIDIFREVIGDVNCSNVPLAYLSDPQWTPQLINKMVNIDPEVDKNAVNYEREFKILTGGKNERVSCNQKHIPTFEFTPRCKLILSANIFPRITDHSSAFYQRLLIIPCERRFQENEKDRQLHDKLKNELPGIFNWVIDGIKRLKARGRFDQYDFMKEAVEELENENNPINIFFKENIEIDVVSDVFIEKGDLYRRYVEWCIATNTGKLNLARFSQCVYKKYHKQTPKDTKMNNKRIWRNIKYVDLHSADFVDKGWQQ